MPAMTEPHRLVVAIDGPAGAGKSSVSRRVAADLGLRYLDTGAMYRALTWWVLQRGIDPQDVEAIVQHAAEAAIAAGTDPTDPTITVDGQDVSGPIRSPEVTAAVSAVSAVPAVRALMVARQRAAIGAGGIVVEGRDIGTVVAPDSAVKVFLTASLGARAERRTFEFDELDDVQSTERDLDRRDSADSGREASPLARASDAHQIDTTNLTLSDVVAQVVELARTACGGAWQADPR